MTSGERSTRRVPRRHLALGFVLATLVCVLTATEVASPAALGAHANLASSKRASARCPWVRAQPRNFAGDRRLALEVDALLTTEEKLGLLNLAPDGHFENSNTGVPRLCIPTLNLQDGPDGLAYADTGVTQLPSSLATGATFDPRMAHAYGEVLGREARAQRIGVVQAPNLNLDRVAEAGRNFEVYGEDPFLAGRLGAAEVRGIQSEGVGASVKHFAGYSQETDRLSLNQVVSVRTLEEVDFAPFRQAVAAGAASVMCAYGQLNGVYACEDRFLFSTLASWGFHGFIRSDLGAVAAPVDAFSVGLDMVKPAATSILAGALASGALDPAAVDDAVVEVLSEMFRFGLIQHPLSGRPRVLVRNRTDAAVALHDAQESIVLLKNEHRLLPLAHGVRRIAVIGTDASAAADVIGGGSSAVRGPFLVTPLAAMRRAFPGRVVFAPGAASVPGTVVIGPATTGADPDAAAPPYSPPPTSLGLAAPEDVVAPALATASSPGVGGGWTSVAVQVTASRTGTYAFSVAGIGDTFLDEDGVRLLSDRGLHPLASASRSITLTAGVPVVLRCSWLRVSGFADPVVTVTDETDAIAEAAAAARRASVAVVFVGAPEAEQVDRPNLSLPGADDALISAVASANPNTVVVLNTGGAVLMPWLSSVKAVLEAWYPGEADGTAITTVLDGRVDPSGRLPITFPASESELPTADPSEFPGVAGTVTINNGLDIGYRYYDATGRVPLFPFGFGESYTRFSVSRPRLVAHARELRVAFSVTNRGRRDGTEVVQAYLGFPPAAGEPPKVLVGFARVPVPAGGRARGEITVPASALEWWQGGGFAAGSGPYSLFLATSSATVAARLRFSWPAAASARGRH